MQRTDEQRANDARLMAQIAVGDQAAFETLYDTFGDLVFSITLSMLRDRQRAEDATQDVWVKLWNAASSFDPTKASVATWLTTLTHRHVIDLIRRAKVRAADQVGAEAGDEVAARIASDQDTEAAGVTAAYSEDVRAALAGLDPQQRQCIELAYFEGLSQSEIAARIGKPLGTVKTYMYQGMRRLRSRLGVGESDTVSHDQQR